MSGGEVVIVLVVVGVASIVQATAGFGFALTAMPLLSTTVGAEHGLAIVSMVALFNSGTTWWTSHRDIHRRVVVVMVISAIAGMPAGLWLLATADERTMRLLIAGSVAVAAVLLGSGFRLRRAGPTVDAIAGLISGALSTSTGTSGPPLVFTLRARNLAAATVRASLAAQFVVTGVVSLGLLAALGHVTWSDVAVSIACLPVLLITWRIGASLFHRLGQHHYDRLTVLLLFAVAIASLLRAL